MGTIEEVKKAEKEAESIRAAARKKADKALLGGKEDAEELRVRSEQEITDLKNSIIAKGKKDTDREAEKIIENARGEAQKVRKKKAEAKLLKSVFEELVKE